MTGNRTTELRGKLRERGIEYEPTRFSTLQTAFTANGVEWVVTENESTGELFVEPRHGLTPEQAIAATLGSKSDETELTQIYDVGFTNGVMVVFRQLECIEDYEELQDFIAEYWEEGEGNDER